MLPTEVSTSFQRGHKTMKLPDNEFRRRVLVGFQVALLGMVTPSLRGITVGWDERRIVGRCFFDGPIGESERETCSDIEAEIMASFAEHDVEVVAERLDAPQDLTTELLDAWVYRRKE